MVSVTGDALSHDLALRTVARDAIRFPRHEHVGGFAALQRVMTNVAVERLLGVRINLMFHVIETCLRHPAVDQNRFCDRGWRIRDRLDLITKSAAREVRTSCGVHPLLRLVGISREEHSALELFAGAKCSTQLPDLLRYEVRHLSVACDSFFQPCVIAVLRRQSA